MWIIFISKASDTRQQLDDISAENDEQMQRKFDLFLSDWEKRGISSLLTAAVASSYNKTFTLYTSIESKTWYFVAWIGMCLYVFVYVCRLHVVICGIYVVDVAPSDAEQIGELVHWIEDMWL